MSDPLAAVVTAALHLNTVSVAIPALDGLGGISVGYERFLPARKLSIAASVQLRESAAGDYTGVRTGTGVELRWYWRANHQAWLSRQPAGSMAGWFTGGRVDVSFDATHDSIDDRWLDTAVELGASAELGYRIAPWRNLEITPSWNLGWRHEFAQRLPGWSRKTVGVGLTVGWLF
ncbi:MAG: hypothetical protein H6Q90_4026 [Deltaproteobacteria bacterium]|nr:hypothetical protein [Deltaproteobacteria bacterium]